MEEKISMRRKWLKVLMLSMMTLASFGRAQMDVKQIEDLLHIMNETKVEFTIPDENDSGDGGGPFIELDTSQIERHSHLQRTTTNNHDRAGPSGC
jgi:hypothetical protein